MRRTLWALLIASIATGCAKRPPTGTPTTTPPPVVQTPSGAVTPGVNASLQIGTNLEHLEPWTTTFKAQLKRNWVVPVKEMANKGRVTIAMVVWKDGRITDVTVVDASPVESFNRSALHAVVASSPTQPLPSAYTQEKTPLTITFYFNESRSRLDSAAGIGFAVDVR